MEACMWKPRAWRMAVPLGLLLLALYSSAGSRQARRPAPSWMSRRGWQRCLWSQGTSVSSIPGLVGAGLGRAVRGAGGGRAADAGEASSPEGLWRPRDGTALARKVSWTSCTGAQLVLRGPERPKARGRVLEAPRGMARPRWVGRAPWVAQWPCGEECLTPRAMAKEEKVPLFWIDDDQCQRMRHR